MAKFTFDVSNYPLVVATFPHDGTLDECRQYSYDIANICRNHKNILYLVDARSVGINAAGQEIRKAVASTFNEIVPIFDKSVIARAHLVNGKIMEGVFTAFNWLLKSKLTSPCKVFSDYDEAVKWLMTFKK